MTHNLEGQQFGMLTVVRKTDERRARKILWEVRCTCGGNAKVATADLLRKDGKARVSCGCMNFLSGPRSAKWQSPNDISIKYWSAAKAGAVRRNIQFDISIHYAMDCFTGKCALSGREIELNSTASLDRIDSSLGYVEGNVQWLHKDINRLKSNWNESQFIRMCEEVVSYQGRRI